MFDLISSRPKLRLLRHLSIHEGTSTGRQLARAVGLDPKNAALALRQLVELGLVSRRRVGTAYLYSLNRNHYLVSEGLIPAFLRERNWLHVLGTEVHTFVGRDAESVVLYGSWARDRAGAQSDIDLLVVLRPGSRAEEVQRGLTGGRVHFAERFGHQVSFLVITRPEFRKRLRRSDPLVLEIVEQGRVLAGKAISELVIRG